MKNKKRMLIILDGCDKTSKSTIGKFLTENLDNTIYIKSGINGSKVNQKEIKKYYLRMINVFKKLTKNYTVIIDRFFASEKCYSFIRGYKYDDKFQKSMEKKLKKMNVLYIYFYDSAMNIISRLDEDYANSNQIQTILDNFEKYNNQTKLKMIDFNYALHEPELLLKFIKEMK